MTKLGYCPACGAELADADRFCGGCGASVPDRSAAPAPVTPAPAVAPPPPLVPTATAAAATTSALDAGANSGTPSAAPSPLWTVTASLPAVPAGFWRRFGAWLIDFALLWAVSLPLALSAADIALAACLYAVSVSSIIYRPLMWRYRNGQTIGQQVLKIRVVRHDGTPIGLGRGVWRVLATWITGFIPLVGRLNVLSMLWNHERRCWFDRWSATRVDAVQDPRLLGFFTR